MAVYVDDAMIPFKGMLMNHMLADTREELLAMATALETSHIWLQKAGTYKEHFDICEKRRAKAIELGAVKITYRDAGRMIYRRRRAPGDWQMPANAVHRLVDPSKTRPVQDDDAEDLYRLIGDCFAEYADQGVVMDRTGADADLGAWASYLASEQGEGYVLPATGGGLAASIGIGVKDNVAELKRFYIAADLRGTGLAEAMIIFIESRARVLGATSMIAWSDSRFTRAHAFYQKQGYVLQKETRALHDPSNTVEALFVKSTLTFDVED